MEIRSADIGIWAFTGGYLVAFDLDEDDNRQTGVHVCLSKDHVLKTISERLDEVDASDASKAAERALRGKK